jgi:hypothetical protein
VRLRVAATGLKTRYDIAVGVTSKHVFYGTEKKEGERLKIYSEGICPC